jgi:hypothetical protein
MSELLVDRAGRRRSAATMPGFHVGRPPRNKGLRYPADPPKVEEIVAVLRAAGDDAHELAREGVPLIVIQRQLGHSNLGITSVYLQGHRQRRNHRDHPCAPPADDPSHNIPTALVRGLPRRSVSREAAANLRSTPFSPTGTGGSEDVRAAGHYEFGGENAGARSKRTRVRRTEFRSNGSLPSAAPGSPAKPCEPAPIRRSLPLIWKKVCGLQAKFGIPNVHKVPPNAALMTAMMSSGGNQPWKSTSPPTIAVYPSRPRFESAPVRVNQRE